jgi:hypothetical protein
MDKSSSLTKSKKVADGQLFGGACCVQIEVTKRGAGLHTFQIETKG